MRALVYGGAFNPPTIAHIELADFARKAAGFDKVIFVPSKMRYITDDQKKDFAFDDETRLAMLRECAKAHEWMKVISEHVCFMQDETVVCRRLRSAREVPAARGMI